MRAFVSWSGGKDSCLSYFKAAGVSCLLNMVTTDAKASMTHGLSSDLLHLQAECIGMPLIQKTATWQTYEENFKEAVESIKKSFGIDAGIFGDIWIEEHRDWVERVCDSLGITPILPLWGRDGYEILKEFVDLGFKAIVVAADTKLEGYLGRYTDYQFIDSIAHIDIDPCGEKGEYHTFVTADGPIFKKRIALEGIKEAKSFRITKACAEEK